MAKKKKDIQKPIPKHHGQPSYNWNDVQNWIERKTGKNLLDWSGKLNYKPDGSIAEEYKNEYVEYKNFWYAVCDRNDVNNNSNFWLSLDPEYYEEEFAKEIIKIIAEEFPETPGYMYCWVSW